MKHDSLSPFFESNGESTPYGQDSISFLSKGISQYLREVQQLWKQSEVENACAIYRLAATGSWHIEYFKAGNSSSVPIDLKVIIAQLISDDYDAVIICHNHPVGTTQPSKADIRTTRNLAQICSLLNIRLLDHIIFGTRPFFSFRQANYL